MTEFDPQRGLDFPIVDGKQSSMSTGTAGLRRRGPDHGCDACVPHRGLEDSRKEYLKPARDLVVSGLRAKGGSVHHEPGRSGQPVPSASRSPATAADHEFRGLRRDTEPALATAEVVGSGRADRARRPVSRPWSLAAPICVTSSTCGWPRAGRAQLRPRASAWLVEHPEWLDLIGVDFAVLGAGAEMGPPGSLLDWGATVWARRPAPPRRHGAASSPTPQRRAGRLMVPVPAPGPGSLAAARIALAAVAGADLLTAGARGPHLAGRNRRGVHARQLRLCRRRAACARLPGHRCDRLGLIDDGHDVMLAWLATPTDVFAVPMEAVEESRRRWRDAGVRRSLRSAEAVRAFRKNYPSPSSRQRGRSTGSATASSRSRVPTTSLPSGYSAGGRWPLARTAFGLAERRPPSTAPGP